MKKNKLSFEKFRIAKLESTESVFGGGSAECVDDGTKDKPPRPRCKNASKDWVIE